MTESRVAGTTPLRRALITGSSRGIGAAIARSLAKDGLEVIVHYNRNVDAASAVLAEIERDGGRGHLVSFDVRDRDDTRKTLAELQERELSIDVLVNNAGITDDGVFPTMREDAWESVTRTTLDGFYNVTQPLVMPMVRKRWGRIINISSVSGLTGNRGQVNYSAAKAGLIGATRSLALELAKRKVTVNAVAPGLIDTDMIAGAPVEEMTAQIPMKRLGRSEEVADLVAFLASDRASYITGQVIGINGGLI